MSAPAPVIAGKLDAAIASMIDGLNRRRNETRAKVTTLSARLQTENAELEEMQRTVAAIDIELAALVEERKRYSTADL